MVLSRVPSIPTNVTGYSRSGSAHLVLASMHINSAEQSSLLWLLLQNTFLHSYNAIKAISRPFSLLPWRRYWSRDWWCNNNLNCLMSHDAHRCSLPAAVKLWQLSLSAAMSVGLCCVQQVSDAYQQLSIVAVVCTWLDLEILSSKSVFDRFCYYHTLHSHRFSLSIH